MTLMVAAGKDPAPTSGKDVLFVYLICGGVIIGCLWYAILHFIAAFVPAPKGNAGSGTLGSRGAPNPPPAPTGANGATPEERLAHLLKKPDDKPTVQLSRCSRRRERELLEYAASFARRARARALSEDMMLALPSKQDCFYILEMIQSSLINYGYIQPWADELIMAGDLPPSWLCDLATKKYQGDLSTAVRKFVFSEPFERPPAELEKFAVACLWLRYERRELSWATFLRMAGDLLDSASGDWNCETLCHYLSVYEDDYFTPAAEEFTKHDYLQHHDLGPWIAEAKARFAPFLKSRMDNKRMHSPPQ
jgi:hypothetical protein